MPDQILEPFDPYIAAERGRMYKGTIPLSQLGRLGDSVADKRGNVQYELYFAKEDNVRSVTGQVDVDIILQCQVCLDNVDLSINAQTRLGLVSSLDEASELSSAYEPLLVVDKKITLIDIVEEELLLAIPIIPRHEQCNITNPNNRVSAEEKENPFSVLADLKLTGDQ